MTINRKYYYYYIYKQFLIVQINILLLKEEVNPLEVIKNQIKFFIERGNYMKKVICLFSAFLLLLSSAMTTYVHETDSQDYLSIPSYNETYSAQSTDNNFLSLKEYNAEYSNGENPLKIDSPLTTQNVPDICYFPYPKTKTIILGQ